MIYELISLIIIKNMATPVLIIDTENGFGIEFKQRLMKLKKELFPKVKKNPDRTRQFYELAEDYVEENDWLLRILDNVSQQARNVFDNLIIKRIFVGNYARKGGSVYQPISEEYFRIYLHLGDPEVYYFDNENYQDEPIVLSEGEGFILPSFISTDTTITVYPDPMRILNDPVLQAKITKLRPRNYNRTTLIYDFELSENFFKTDDEDVENSSHTDSNEDDENSDDDEDENSDDSSDDDEDEVSSNDENSDDEDTESSDDEDTEDKDKIDNEKLTETEQ